MASTQRQTALTPREAAGSEPAEEPSQALAKPLDQELVDELPVFENFFKTFGFKRIHGRVWGLLVLSDGALSSRQISETLGISQGATSTTLNELGDWGAITSQFDSSRRCNLHTAVGNTLSIVATVFRRREQVVFQQFKQTSERALEFIRKRYGERDPRVFTLRSIITTCELGEALMQLVFSAVSNALEDNQSLLSKALHAALRVGMGAPRRALFKGKAAAELEPAPRREDD